MEEELLVDGIAVGEIAPQTEKEDHADNQEEENAGEEADEEQGNEQSQSKSEVDRLLQERNQCYSLEETEPSKEHDHSLLIPKVEETSESKKEPDYEKSITQTDKLEATSSAPVTTVVPSEGLLDKVAERKTSRLQYQANHPSSRYQKNIIHVLSQNLRSPFEPGTQVKGVLNRYAKVYTLTEHEEVIYGPVGDASKFFDIYLKQREWLEDEHMDAALSLYRLRFQQHPSMFQSTEIAIMAVAFQILWAHQYENWKSTSFLPEQSLGSHGYFHPDRTVKIYDSGKPKPGDVQLREVAEPFARMVPYELWFYAEEERKPSVDRTDFSIECIWKGVSTSKIPIWGLNMGLMRENIAAGMYVESARANANMWDPEFVTKMIDAAVPVK
ncbi:hypothetical protein Bca101_075412 [Brassica carinata]